MSLEVEFVETIDRPVETVFQFFAVQHVRNHPRWDPDMELEQVTDGPIGVGTVIRRVNSHSGTPVEGTMKVVEFEPNRYMGVVIHDGPLETRARVTFEAIGEEQTRLVTYLEIPSLDDSTDTAPIVKGIQRSADNRRQLIENET
jgi:uncharacterized protein YndB with AHSA1/START domain